MPIVYLDNNATTAVSIPVLRKQAGALLNLFGNPSDQYRLGVVVKREIDNARHLIADLVGANLSQGDKIIFTSCATESNNSVFYSATRLYPQKRHIIVSAVEHLSVLAVARDLERHGYRITYVPVNFDGNLDLEYLGNSLDKDTLLISIMTANNETGVVLPIEKVVEISHSYSPDILVHTDAVQSVGKMPINARQIGVDFLSLSGHKFHAPKGIGALFIRAGVEFSPLLLGGHQEKLQRAGTENTASIIAMGEAAKIAIISARKQDKVIRMRDSMEKVLKLLPTRSIILGEKAERLPNTTSIAFSNVSGYELMLKLSERDIFVSTGSACNSGSEGPSHVIKAMGISREYQMPIRISTSDDTTQEEIDGFLIEIQSILVKGRS